MATNSVHSIHGGSFGNGSLGDQTPNANNSGVGTGNNDQSTSTVVHTNNVMESPNSISSVDLQQQQQTMQQPPQHYNCSTGTGNNADMNLQQQHVSQQHQQSRQQQQQQQQQHQQQPQHVPQASPHNPMTVPSPAASVASNVHPASLPSQSPHSQHNMTSPHPQPSPHQTSPHPMTISPAAHSPYASAAGTPQGGGVHAPSLPSQSPHNMPQPQPSPQPSQSQQQGS